MHSTRGERGSALVAAMVALFVVSGVIATLLTVAMSTSNEVEVHRNRAESLTNAQLGLDRAIATLYKAPLSGGLLAVIGENGSDVVWRAFANADAQGVNQDVYRVYYKSFKRDPNLSEGPNYDVYEITSVSEPVGAGGLVARRALRTVVAVPKVFHNAIQRQVVANPTQTEIIKTAFPSAFGAAGTVRCWSAAASISGHDHDIAANRIGGDGVYAMSGNGNTCHNGATVTTEIDGIEQNGISAMKNTTNDPPQVSIADLVNMVKNLPSVQAAPSGLPNKNDGAGWGVTSGYRIVKSNFSGNLNSNDLAAGQTGSGILLLTGNVTINADFRWKGLVIVEGNLETKGNAGLSWGGFLSTGSINAQASIDYRYSSEVIGDVLSFYGLDPTTALGPLVTVERNVTTQVMTNVGVPRRITWREIDDGEITRFLASLP